MENNNNLQHLTPKCANNEQKQVVTNEVVTPTTRKVFLISELLIGILQCLHIREIIQLQQINHDFDNISQFTYSIEDNEMNFDYENVFIKHIIERDICNSIKSLGIWYIQTVNFKNQTDRLPIVSRTTTSTRGLINNFQFICKVSEPTQLNKETSKTTTISSIDEPNCGVLKVLYFQLKNCDEKTIAKEFMGNNTVISDLLVSNLYGIIPLINKLSLLLNENESFQNSICFERFSTSEKVGEVYETPKTMRFITDMLEMHDSVYPFTIWCMDLWGFSIILQ